MQEIASIQTNIVVSNIVNIWSGLKKSIKGVLRQECILVLGFLWTFYNFYERGSETLMISAVVTKIQHKRQQKCKIHTKNPCIVFPVWIIYIYIYIYINWFSVFLKLQKSFSQKPWFSLFIFVVLLTLTTTDIVTTLFKCGSGSPNYCFVCVQNRNHFLNCNDALQTNGLS